MPVEVVERSNKILESILFRIIIALIGSALCFFYGGALLGANILLICHPESILIDHFPESAFYLGLYLGGVISGLLCFIYSANPRKRKLFFVIILPFLVLLFLSNCN
jgi:hypothetical protein